MTVRLVVSLGGGVRITPGTKGPLEDLANRLTDAETEVRVISQEPQGRGVTWGEVVIIYIATKALDNLTDKALDAFFARIAGVARKWAREQVQERSNAGHARVRPTFVEPRNQSGELVGPTVVKAEADSEGNIEVTEIPTDERFRRPIQFDPSWLEGNDPEGS
jgi:hypothetical protein